MTVYTPSLRLWQGTPFDVSIKGSWGTPLNTNDNLLEAAILGTTVVSVAGLSTLTLSTANGAADQARNYVQQYTGALTVDCTVLLPNVPKFGFARNSTTGGHNIILNAGAGTTATIPPDGNWHYYWSDGATNITLPQATFGPPLSPTALVATTGNFSGLITPTSTIGIKGTTAGDQAQVGSVGEYLSVSALPPGIALTNNVNGDVTSLVLSAGDWTVGGDVNLLVSNSATVIQGWLNTVSASTPVRRFISVGTFANSQFTVPTIRINSSLATVVYLSAFSNFTAGTVNASGTIWARRAR